MISIKKVLILKLYILGFLSVSEAQEGFSTTQKDNYQIDLNIGIADWLRPKSFNNNIEEVPLHLRISAQQSINKTFSFVIDLAGTRAKEKERNHSSEAETSSYLMGYILPGMKLSFGEKVKFYAIPQVGLSVLRIPQYLIGASPGLISHRQAETVFSFAFGGQLGMEVPFSNRFYLKSGLAFFCSSYRGATTIVEGFGASLTTNQHPYEKYRHRVLLYTLGVGLRFSKVEK